jgi:N6-adenosine-specific RNA methylase IME4
MDYDRKEQLTNLNLGNVKDLKNVLISWAMSSQFVKGVEALLQNYKDVFAWSYKEFQGKYVSIKLN